MTTGEGGALVTDNRDVYERCLTLKAHGRTGDLTKYCCYEVAYKYAMSDLQAALGLAQLERVDELVNKKRQIFQWYAQQLSDCSTLTLNPTSNNTNNSYWLITALLDPSLGLDKHFIAQELEEIGITIRPMFDPLSSIPAYAQHEDTPRARQVNHHAYSISPYAFNLPSGLTLQESDVQYICQALLDITKKYRYSEK